MVAISGADPCGTSSLDILGLLMEDVSPTMMRRHFFSVVRAASLISPELLATSIPNLSDYLA